MFGLVLLLALSGCTDGADDPQVAGGETVDDGDAAPVRKRTETPTPVKHSTSTLLQGVAEKTGLSFSGGGDELPIPAGDLDAMPPGKLLRKIAENAGLVPVIDTKAVEAGQGGIHLTERFLLAGTTDEIADLVRLLDTPDAEARELALANLAERTGLLRPLILGGVLATDAAGDVRAEAATLLGEERDDRGVEALIAALGDEDPFVAETARASLVLMGDAYVRPALLAAAKYGSAAVRQAARQILDENFGMELDPDTETAGAGGTPAHAIVVHNLEGRTRCVRLDAGGDCDVIMHVSWRVTARRNGRLENAPELLETLARCGATEPPPPPSRRQPGLVREPDSFVLHMLGRDGSRSTATGDLRDHPPAVRQAVSAVLDAGGKLPEVASAAHYALARKIPVEEAEAGPIHTLPEDEGQLQRAAQFPGWPVAVDATALERQFGDKIGPWTVRWRDGYAELNVLRAAAGDSD